MEENGINTGEKEVEIFISQKSYLFSSAHLSELYNKNFIQMASKIKQVAINQYGTPDVLKMVEVDMPLPKAGEALIKVNAIGVNYSDILRRQNKY